MKIHLRQRKQGTGKISLYLEFYKGSITNDEGKVKNLREYEYLNLYLIDKPKTAAEKQQNKEIKDIAEGIKAKRELEYKNGLHGFKTDFKEKTNFVDFLNSLATKRKESKGNFGNWDSMIKHFVKYAGLKISFKEIDQSFCEGFKDYLKKTAKTSSGEALGASTVASYFTKFRTALNEAVKKQIIMFNYASEVKIPKVPESKREYLTLDEVKLLAKTECRYDVLKRAFIFSCLTGLRWSDIQNLKWSDIQNVNDGWRITFHQQKTKGLQYLDISEQAKSYLGEVSAPNDRVFIGLKYSSYMNVALNKWMLKAGITKDITFHSARHTFAVIQLSLGTEIYTLSKLLGHTELKTTQIYAKIVDDKKREAVNKIPDINI